MLENDPSDEGAATAWGGILQNTALFLFYAGAIYAINPYRKILVFTNYFGVDPLYLKFVTPLCLGVFVANMNLHFF